MWKVTWKGLAAHKFRFVLTAISVVLGVAFVAGTFVLTDTLGRVFDGLFADTTKGVDAVVRGRQAFGTAGIGSTNQDDNREPVPASLLDRLERVDGVAAAEGSAAGTAIVVGSDGKPVINGRAPSLGVPWGASKQLNQSFRLVEGRRPTAPGEVAIDTKTVDEGHLRLGDEVQILFAQTPPQRMRLVGIFSFGSTGNLAGATLAAFEPATAQQVLNRVGTWDLLQFAAEPGVSQRTLADRLQAEIDRLGDSSSYEVLTGDQYAQEQSDTIKKNLSFFNTFLLVFAFVALFVGAFIIYNTFSIVVAQRMRELALLRALGATGRQVRRSVAGEAVVVGALSSVVGIVAGIGVAIGLQALLKAFGIDLPSTAPVLKPRTVVVAFVVGTGVTFLSAISPARRAARVPPVAALRDAALDVHYGHGRYWGGGAVTLAGLVLLVVGLFGRVKSSDVPGGAATVVGLAAFCVFVGVAMLSPLVARPVGRALGWPSARLRGVSGQLAQANAVRQPRRTATTAAALMIGIALVSFIAIVGSSAKRSFVQTIDRTLRADFVLSGKQFSPLGLDVEQAVREAVPGSTVVPLRFGNVQVQGKTTEVLGTPPDIEQVIDIKLRPGADLEGFARDGVLVYADKAKEEGWKQGDAITLDFAKTGPQDVTIRGFWAEKDGLPYSGSYLLSLTQFERSFTDQQDTYIGVRLAGGASLSAARKSLDTVVKQFPNLNVQDRAQFKADQIAQFDQILNLVSVMLAFAVVIALIGIVNTLALSVFERTRELGLLRAVGMTRAQLKRMIRSEAVIVAVFGALLGLALGILFSGALVHALSDQGVSLSLPWTRLVTFVVLAALAGLGAGSFPARRAAKLDVLRAVSAE